jgi:thymidylate synthase
MLNKLDKQYTDLLQTILEHGVDKKDRTGTGTKSIFGYTIRHNMKDGFPLLTTKKMPFKTIVTELLWFLQGNTNIKYLVDNNCHIWDGDAYKNYLKWVGNDPLTMEEFIEKIKTDSDFCGVYGELGPIYGKQWRSWGSIDWKVKKVSKFNYIADKHIDQIQNLINDLKTNPDSRRLMVNAWNVGELNQMVLPPCHYGFQVYTRELSHEERYNEYNIKFKDRCTADCYTKEDFDSKGIPARAISLMWNQRSVDTFLGLPFNIASYGLLLMMLADEVNMIPDQLIGNLGDVHLYSNHIEQAKEQIGRDLTNEERYNIWFSNNYETGMERFFNPNELPDFDNEYYKPTPTRTREPYPLPTVHVRDGIYCSSIEDVLLFDYQSHPTIKAPLSN